MALRLSGLQTSCRPLTTGGAPGNPTGRIRQRRHPAIRAGLPDGATLIGPTISCRPFTTGESFHDRGNPGKSTGRIRQRRHPAICTGLPDGAALIGPTISCRPLTTGESVHDRGNPGKPHRPDQATPPSGYLHGTARWRYAYRVYKHRAGRSQPGSPFTTGGIPGNP